ncbi:MAG: sigma-70 family RNA polymerase sigma factor, partial [Demequinaceae bacterium]|nr:sigma-70 family RNA polymerase sigma factor [Demequinaceae bacterium]
MGEVQVSLWTHESSDAELLAGVRGGESAAFGILFERHAAAARRVASMYSAAPSDVDDIVSESFARVLKILQEGGGPDLAFRAYLFTVIRRTGLDTIRKAKKIGPEDIADCDAKIGYSASSDEPTLTDFEHSVVADAFKSLPERWQVVLWYTEIEKKAPAEVAPLLGLSPNGVAALAYRAREALRQAYLQQHLATTEDASCLSVSEHLSAYVRGGLTKREHAKVEAHVRQCDRCEALVAELEDVNRGLRAVIAPIILGVIGLGALEASLPIGGIGASSVAAGAGVGAGGAGGAGTATIGASASGGLGAGVTSGIGGAVVAAGGASAATSAFTQGSVAVTTAMANTVATVGTSGATLLTAAAATIGVAALAVSGAGLIGGLSTYHGEEDVADSSNSVVDLIMSPDNALPGRGLPPVPEDVTPAEEAPVTPPVEPGPPAPKAKAAPVLDPDPEPDPDPIVDPDPDPEPDPDPIVDPDPDPEPDPGPVIVISDGSINITIGNGGNFFLTLAAPAIEVLVSNVDDRGSTPITLVFVLPDGLTFIPDADGK